MKRMMLVAIALLLVFGVWGANTGQHATSVSTIEQQTQYNNRFEITPWGALKTVRDKSGKEVYGKERSPNEGVAISYQQLHPKTKKPIGNPQVAYFFSDKSTEKERCKFCPQSRFAVTSKTKDGVLTINSNFYLDPKTGLLKIVRFIQNLSNNPIAIYASAQADARLSTETPVNFGIIDPKHLASMKIAESKGTSFVPGSLPISLTSSFFGFDLIPIPCVLCPDRCGESLVTVWPSKDKYVCAECVKGDNSDEMKILWEIRETSSPNCKNPIKLTSTLTSYIVCIDCKKDGGGSTLSHNVPLPNPTLLASKINAERDSCKSNDLENCCKLAIGVDGQSKSTFKEAPQNVLGAGQVMAITNTLNLN